MFLRRLLLLKRLIWEVFCNRQMLAVLEGGLTELTLMHPQARDSSQESQGLSP